MVLTNAKKSLALDVTRVMGILNVTVDSFSDGGEFIKADAAIQQAEKMLAAGADIIDIGGESTRPGAAEVSEQEELDRILPVVEKVVHDLGALVSLDTSRKRVMKEGLAAGAFMVNDVRALREPGVLEFVAASGAPVCIMHMLGSPRTMQENPVYDDVVREVREFLTKRRNACIQAGVSPDNIVLDPGFGFGKTLKHNLCLLHSFDTLSEKGVPTLAGMSRKRMFGEILGDAEADRTSASVAAALIATQKDASIVRVHDVAETVQALKVQQAVDKYGEI